MNKQEMVDALFRVEANAKRLREAIEGGLLVRVRDGFAGHPKSPSFDAGASTSHRPADDDPAKPREYLAPELRGALTSADPTGSAAVQALNYGDRGKQDAKAIGAAVKAMDAASRTGADTAARYSPRAPSLADAASGVEDAGCPSCARVTGHGGKPLWNPPTRTTTLASGVKVSICDWCYATPRIGARWTGQYPPVEDVVSRRDTGRARKQAS